MICKALSVERLSTTTVSRLMDFPVCIDQTTDKHTSVASVTLHEGLANDSHQVGWSGSNAVCSQLHLLYHGSIERWIFFKKDQWSVVLAVTV